MRSQNFARFREWKEFLFFLKWSFSRALVSWFLGCGQSPLWVWFVGKCPISEPCSTPTLCETCSSQGWDQWFFLFPFGKFWHFSTWKSDDPWEPRVRKPHCVKSLSVQVFTGEPIAQCALWSCTCWGCESLLLQTHKKTPNSVRAVPRSRCCKIQKFSCCQLWRKLHWWRSASLRGKMKAPKWVSKLEQDNRCQKHVQQLSLEFPFLSVVSQRTETWSWFHRGQKWLENQMGLGHNDLELSEQQPGWFQPPHQAGFAHPDLKK